MSSEDLNLPASLERLEINPESRLECSKTEENPFSLGGSCPLKETPECSLETLSLKAICPKGSCLCNKKKDGVGRSNPNISSNVSGNLKSIVHHRRPIIRRSKLNREVLRAPILKLGGNETAAEPNSTCKTSAPYKTLDGNKGAASNSRTEPVAICCAQQYLLQATAVPTSTIQRPNYLSTAATSSHCCALQARSINNNNNNNNNNHNNNINNGSGGNAATDDTNIDELASYFDLFVHIPKKMSVMAEMMYI